MKNRRTIRHAGMLLVALTAGATQAALIGSDTFKASSAFDYSGGIYKQSGDILSASGNATCYDTSTNHYIVGFSSANSWTNRSGVGYNKLNFGQLLLEGRKYTAATYGRQMDPSMAGKHSAYAKLQIRMDPGGVADSSAGLAVAGWSSGFDFSSGAINIDAGASVGFKWNGSDWNLVLRYNQNGSVAYENIMANAITRYHYYNVAYSMDDQNDTIKVWMVDGLDAVLDHDDAPNLTVTDWSGTVEGISDMVVSFGDTSPLDGTGDNQVRLLDVSLGDTWADVGMIPEPGTLSLLGMATLGALLIRRIRI